MKLESTGGQVVVCLERAPRACEIVRQQGNKTNGRSTRTVRKVKALFLIKQQIFQYLSETKVLIY